MDRKRLYYALETHEPGDQLASIISFMLVALIGINLIAIILESIPSYEAAYGHIFNVIEYVSCFIFVLEYIARVWVCVEAKTTSQLAQTIEVPTNNFAKRLRHVTRPMAIIDLLAFLPSILTLLFPGLDLRFLRILRLFRVFKLTRYFSSLEVLLNVLYDERKSLMGTFLIMLIVLTLAASALYIVEHEQQPETFGSIPQAMWWAMAALTTVGYGDAIPMTAVGKILGSIVTILGIGMVALPSGILAASFSEHLRHKRESLQNHIDRAFEDGVLTKDEANGIINIGTELGLSEEVVDQLVQRTSQMLVEKRMNITDDSSALEKNNLDNAK
ncbi:MAG: ion transporter [Pseudomonadales bacterium]|jgi:voltage-gated potassium channel|nr:ion transporter [Pseudomonadales bacterium]